MVNTRLIPYVEIPNNPKIRRRVRTPSPENVDVSSRKKQRFHQSRLLDEDLVDSESEASDSQVSDVCDTTEYQYESGCRFPRSETSPTSEEVSSRYPYAEIQVPFIYKLSNDDMLESEDLAVPGEIRPDEGDDEVPVRIVHDFVIYDAESNAAVSVAELLQLEYTTRKYRASGLVNSWAEAADDASVLDDEPGDEDEESKSLLRGDQSFQGKSNMSRISLTDIVEFNIHSVIQEKDSMDSKIYIRTKYAWYILGTPLLLYNPFFCSFWIQQRICHLVIMSSLNTPRITMSEFIKDLRTLDQTEDSVATAYDILGREFDEEDVQCDEVITYIISSLPDICAINHFQISRVPLIREIMGGVDYEFEPVIPCTTTQKRKSTSKASIIHKPSVTKYQSKTFLTPIVNRIAEKLFDGSLEVARSLLDNDNPDGTMKLHQHRGHHSNPKRIVWGEKLPGDEGAYESVDVDGVTYKIGDVVMVEPDSTNTKKSKASQTVNKYGNRWWFCQIQYFYQKINNRESIKMFHGIWFSHGSETILQETSHSKALYMLGSCDDNLIASIFKKCNIRFLQPGDEEAVDDGDHNSNDFHCGLFYDADNAAFVDIPSETLVVDLQSSRSCYSCDIKDKDFFSKEVQYPQTDTLILHGTVYHVQDYVYIHPFGENTKILNIGQITKINNSKIHVQYLGHYDDYVQHHKQKKGPFLSSDERCLFFTEDHAIVDMKSIDGKCQVLHLTDSHKIQQWIKEDDHYYLNQKGNTRNLLPMDKETFTYCKCCYQEDRKKRKLSERFLQNNSKLIGMELFSGAGGLGVGMNMSGFVETKYAVEFAPSAAKTYRINHPETTVYCQDSSALLKHAITSIQEPDISHPSLPSLDQTTDSPCPPLPHKYEQIDFIFGGPPCQSFSLANHSKRRDDIRSTIPCNMLSYVEHYEPKYFLLENVYGFLLHKFYDRRDTGSGMVESEIESGMVKLVMRTLIALGYQVHYKLLQAAQYGVPQSRKRVIFWGAKCGLPLPEFPVPVYAYPKGMNRVGLPTGEKLMPVTRSKDPDSHHQFAPLRPITVDMAIGDLPKFDWINPHKILPATKQDKLEQQQRCEKLKIPAFNAEASPSDQTYHSLPGFPGGAPYETAPQNSFQRWLRQDMDNNAEVTGQYTAMFRSSIVEATATVPMRATANHQDLPSSLLPVFAQNKNFKRTLYGRMDSDGFFKCALTQMSPVLKDQHPLHPSQKRIITVREAARCQGFPDDYIFMSVAGDNRPKTIVEDQLKQIGNAVAVPFSLALGKELGKAMILAWAQKEKEGSVPL